MRLYLTSRWDRREELRGYRDQLRALGHTVQSSWLDSTLVLDDPATELVSRSGAADGGGGLDPAHGSDMSFGEFKVSRVVRTRAEWARIKVAEMIFAEITECDGLIAFTDSRNATHGAALAEFGMALGQNKRVWIVGERRHVLHYHDVPAFPTWKEFIAALTAMEKLEHA